MDCQSIMSAIADCAQRQWDAIQRSDWARAHDLADRMDNLQGQMRECLFPTDPEWRTEAAEAAGRG